MLAEDKFLSIIRTGIANGSMKDINSVVQHGGIHAIDALFLYCSTIVKAPKYVIEFSPHHGRSTICIASALKYLNQGGRVATFELNSTFGEEFNRVISEHKVSDQVEIIFGDALETIPRFIHDHELNQKVGLLFVDSDHSEKFADQYVKKIFPLMEPKCTIGIHDIGAIKSGGIGEFNTSLIVRNNNWEEYKTIQKWVKDHDTDYILLHGLMGGMCEGSANLPTNNKLYDIIEKLIGRNLKFPNQAPRSIWFEL